MDEVDPLNTRLREQALMWALERVRQTNASYNAAGVVAEAEVFYQFLKGEELTAQ